MPALSRRARPALCRKQVSLLRRKSSGWRMHFGHPRRPLARSVGLLPARPAAADVPARRIHPMQRRAWLRGWNLQDDTFRSWRIGLRWSMAAACSCRCRSPRHGCIFCEQAYSWAMFRKAALCRNTTFLQLSAVSAQTGKAALCRNTTFLQLSAVSAQTVNS